MTTIIENGKRYEIEDGTVVSASVEEPAPDTQEEVELKLRDRVAFNGRVGQIIGIGASVYGTNAAVLYDDGEMEERLLEDLQPAPVDKTASVTIEGFEGEYEAYLAMPTVTATELAIKENKARELNLRAKDEISKTASLSDQLLYDRVITETSIDMTELKEATQFAQASEDGYLEKLPKYTSNVASEVLGYGIHQGDASWLDNAADEFENEVPSVEDAELAERASAVVAGLNNDQLSDPDFMKKVLEYSLQTVPAEHKTAFAGFVREAKHEKLETQETPVHLASSSQFDLDGNSINLDDVPFEAIFGV